MHAPRSPAAVVTFRRDVIAWMVTFCLIGGFAVAWKVWQNHPETRKPLPVAAVAADPRITVLAYDRIVKSPDPAHVDAERLRTHIDALRAQGFEPISVQSLYDFYYASGKLPARPVLLVFDHGYLDTYEAVHPVLLETGWRAAVSLATAAQERRDSLYVYWDRLLRMVHSGYWEVMSQGHATRETVRTGPKEGEAPFITTAEWIRDERRPESDQEFFERIAQDLSHSADFIRSRLDVPVLGYVFPFGTPARVYSNGSLLLAEQQARAFTFPLAFSDDDFGVNDQNSNPQDLKRLRVASDWSADELMRRINSSRELPPEGDPLQANSHWIVASGDLSSEKTLLHLSGPRYAQAWLAGSQWATDWTLNARVRPSHGDFWFVHSDAARGTEWRFGGGAGGLYLKQMKRGITVATNTFPFPSSDTWHDVAIIKRGSGVWVEWDGRPVSEHPTRLVEAVDGPIGWMVWAGDGDSELTLSGVRFARQRYAMNALSNFPSANEVQVAAAQAKSTAALTRPQFELDNGSLTERQIDNDLFALLQYRYAWQIVPGVALKNLSEKQAPELEALVTRAGTEGWGGLNFDISELDPADLRKAAPILANLEKRIRASRQRFLVTRDRNEVADSAASLSSLLSVSAR